MSDIDRVREHAKWLANPTNVIRPNLRWSNLVESDLRNANLAKADLRNSNLVNANLRFANLLDTDLSKVNLSNANLSDANLSNANLSNANLRWADLRWANLSNANLRGADLRNANLKGSNLRGVARFLTAMIDGRGFQLKVWYENNGAEPGIWASFGCRSFPLKEALAYWGDDTYTPSTQKEKVEVILDKRYVKTIELLAGFLEATSE